MKAHLIGGRLYRKGVKPIGDRLVAGLLVVLLAPIMAIVAILVAAKLGSPVIFKQDRIGLNGRPFTLYKFRTMAPLLDEHHTDESRLSRFGAALRASSLDELPQLWNVVFGTMSLVGPRPLLVDYHSLYSEGQRRRHEVRPGLTGWAQVHGRNEVGWERRFELDTWYVDNLSFRTDLAIVCRTVPLVILRAGIRSEGVATMPPFTG